MTKLKFSKMEGLGNDFMLIDGISQHFTPDPKLIAKWGGRHFGVGFDQLLLIEKPDKPGVEFKYRIFNCDGGEVEQCGNGARCFAKYVYNRGLTTNKEIKVQTMNEDLLLKIVDFGLIEVNMGKPKLNLEDIPFIPAKDKMQTPFIQVISIGAISLPVVCVNVGNPHAVVMVDDVANVPIEAWGRGLEFSEQFPKRTNVEFVQVLDKHHIKLRVHERGVGETLACGTGACAAVVAGVLLEQLDNKVQVSLPGGDLEIKWTDGNDILMKGPAEFVFDGEIVV